MEEEEEYDWTVPFFLAARGAKVDVPEGEADSAEKGMSGIKLARRALDEGASLVAREPATGLTALQLACTHKVVDLVRYLQLRYVRAMAAGLQVAGNDGSQRSDLLDVPLPKDITHDPTAQLIEAVSTGDLTLAQQARAGGAILSTIDVLERKQDIEAMEPKGEDEELDDDDDELDVARSAVHQLELLRSVHSEVFEFVDSAVQNAPQELLKAAKVGSIKMAKSARAAGADLETLDSEYSYTPLLWAARVGSTDLIEYLLNEGAVIESQATSGSYRGSTPLLEATAWSNVPAMEMLLSWDPPAAVDATRGDGATPLCIAAWVGHDAAVRVLLRHGASLEHKFEGQSALQLAKRHGHQVATQLLRDEKARRKYSKSEVASVATSDNWLRRKKV